MSFHYVHGLDILSRIQRCINESKSDIINHRMTVQKWYALGRLWNLLRMALISTAEAADTAVYAAKQQRARTRLCASVSTRYGNNRNGQADACLRQFRYVTALSQHARIVKQHHEAELLSWENYQGHYEGALGPQAHAVRDHQRFLDELDRKIAAVKRHQGLERVYVRWLQFRAAANLRQQAKNFHLARKALDFRKKKVDKARGLAEHLQQAATRCVEEYEYLEAEVGVVQSVLKSWWGISQPDGKISAVSAVVKDGNAERMAPGQ